MAAQPMTKSEIIVRYLAWAGGDCPVWSIVEYMAKWHRTTPRATRQCLWRLHEAGRIERTRWGYYRGADAGQAEHEAGALATHYQDSERLK